MTAHEVVDAWRVDTRALGTVLARSFEDDPVMQWLCPVEERRAPSLEGFFRAELDSTAKRGRVVTTADRGGAALWAAPGQWKIPLLDMVRVGPLFLRASRSRTVAAVRLLAKMEKVHPKAPHWYLAVLGTDPSRQGRGVGSGLVARGGATVRHRGHRGLPRVLEGPKRALLQAFRLRGHRRDPGCGVTAPVDDVAGAQVTPVHERAR